MDIKPVKKPRAFDDQLIDRKDLKGVEIGAYLGEHAWAMLDKLSIKKLYLIDPYTKYPEYSGVDAAIWERLLHAEDVARELVGGPNVEFMIMKSMEAVGKFEDKTLDFVYIDGNHKYKFVKDDITYWMPKLKKGGLMGGHDYHLSKYNYGVRRAVDEYVKKHKIDLKTEAADWFFWKK